MRIFKNRPRFTYPWFWKDLKYSISSFFFPRNKWASKLIPRKWSDKPELIQEFLFAALIDYVEQEEGIKGYTEEFLKDCPEHQVHCYREVCEIYPLVKALPGLMDKNSSEWNCNDESQTKVFMEESTRLEKLEQELCERIVKIRGSLWT